MIQSQTFAHVAAPNQPVAVIDIGSNSVRLDIRDHLAPDAEILHKETEFCKLAQGLKADGRLSDKKVDLLIKTLKGFRSHLENHGVGDVLAVATDALRRATNQADVLQKVQKKTGFEVRILSEEEEARLMALGVVAGFPDQSLEGLVADLGGGSLELVWLVAGKVAHWASLPLGIRQAIYEDWEDQQGKLEVHLKAAFEELGWLKDLQAQSVPRLYTVGGTWRACARLERARLALEDIRDVHGHEITATEVAGFCDWLISSEFTQSEAANAIRERRHAEVPLAAFILKSLWQSVGEPPLVISQYGIREGCLMTWEAGS